MSGSIKLSSGERRTFQEQNIMLGFSFLDCFQQLVESIFCGHVVGDLTVMRDMYIHSVKHTCKVSITVSSCRLNSDNLSPTSSPRLKNPVTTAQGEESGFEVRSSCRSVHMSGKVLGHFSIRN